MANLLSVPETLALPQCSTGVLSPVRISLSLLAGTVVGMGAWHCQVPGWAPLSSWAGPAWHWDADTSAEKLLLSLAQVLRLFQGAKGALPGSATLMASNDLLPLTSGELGTVPTDGET